MTSPAEYQNRLEQAFASLPGVVQDALRPAYKPVDDAIHWVCGDPTALLNAGQHYVTVGSTVSNLAGDITRDVSTLEADWSDAVGDAFRKKMNNISKAVQGAGTAIGDTDKILQAAAQAAVDAANTICDIVVSVVEFIIADFAISAALAAFTFGASVAAGVMAAVADWAEATFEVSRVVEAIVKVLRAVENVLRELAELFRALRELFMLLHKLKKEAGFFSKTAMKITIAKLPISIPTKLAWNAIPGLPNLPKGGVHWGEQAGKDGKGVYDDVKQADNVDG